MGAVRPGTRHRVQHGAGRLTELRAELIRNGPHFLDRVERRADGQSEPVHAHPVDEHRVAPGRLSRTRDVEHGEVRHRDDARRENREHHHAAGAVGQEREAIDLARRDRPAQRRLRGLDLRVRGRDFNRLMRRGRQRDRESQVEIERQLQIAFGGREALPNAPQPVLARRERDQLKAAVGSRTCLPDMSGLETGEDDFGVGNHRVRAVAHDAANRGQRRLPARRQGRRTHEQHRNDDDRAGSGHGETGVFCHVSRAGNRRPSPRTTLIFVSGSPGCPGR